MLRRALVIFIPACALFGASASALAAAVGETCATDDDCSDGLACEVTGGTACACAAGQECDCPPSTDIKTCVPGPCTSDADCGAGLVCLSYEVPCNATEPACPPDSTCAEPAHADPCTPETKSICAPKWVAPCETADDCGAGFTCEPDQACTCTGSGETPRDPSEPGSGGSDGSSGSGDSGDDGSGDFAPQPPEGDCTCAPADTNSCRLVAVACDDAAACPSGWTCEHAIAPGIDCPPSDGSGDEPACDPTPPSDPGPGQCVPPGYAAGVDLGVPRDAGTGESATDDHTSTPTTPTADNAGTGTKAEGGACAGGPEAPLALGLALLALIALRRRAA